MKRSMKFKATLVVLVGTILALAVVLESGKRRIRSRSSTRLFSCQENLLKIDGAKEQWKLEHGAPEGADVTWSDIVTGTSGYLRTIPKNPGCSYIINPIGTDPECTIPGPLHSLSGVGNAIPGEVAEVSPLPGQSHEMKVKATEPPPADKFRDGAGHYRKGNDTDGYAAHAPGDVAAIADNILLHQRDNGGWTSNWDPQRVLSPEEKERLAAGRDAEDTTLDNRATYPQIEYLAAAYARTSDARYLDAALRGLEFMLAAQHPCGGFPHSWPRTDNYRPRVTFMDDVTAGALTTLRKAAAGAEPFGFLAAPGYAPLRERITEASRRGLDCVLRLQQRHDGRLTVWAGQYDPVTLEPAGARSFELPSLVCAESVGVVRYLTGAENPTPEITNAIAGAMEWFRAARIDGLRIERFDIEPERFEHHTARQDVRLVADPASPGIWARFYEFDSMRPVLANRDGVKVDSLDKVLLERRTGYSWYGTWPAALLRDLE